MYQGIMKTKKLRVGVDQWPLTAETREINGSNQYHKVLYIFNINTVLYCLGDIMLFC